MTKKIFMLLAAVLMSLSAMAQSSEPVRSDLNDDGRSLPEGMLPQTAPCFYL